MNKFGWSYPPGAENDPSAPYNQTDEDDNGSSPTLDQFDLDAFGHMNWTAGWGDDGDERGDWLACVDADRQGDWVGYHVVVDSDSGGFVDTMESGVVTVEEACKSLPGLLEYWRDIASEHLVASGDWFTDEETRDDLKAIENWKQHIEQLLDG